MDFVQNSSASKLIVKGKLEDRALLIRGGKLVNTFEWKAIPEDISIQGTGEKLYILLGKYWLSEL